VEKTVWSAFGLWALVCTAACGQILGIEDHRFAGSAGGGVTEPADGVVPSCDDYCEAVVTNCDADPIQAFSNNDLQDCLAFCSHLPPGSAPDETGVNSVSCRAHYAAEASGAERDLLACPAAAPGGGTPATDVSSCGSNCDAYCDVYAQVCPEQADSQCAARCPGLPDRGEYSAQADFAEGSDSIQCRIAHLTAAARAKVNAENATNDETRATEEKYRVAHCGHSKLRPSLLADDMPCDLKSSEAPNCADYCKLIQTACVSDNKVYDNPEQCVKVCESGFATPTGVPTGVPDINQDTLSCRRWHAYFALTDDPGTHCTHAGPAGGGHCGDNGNGDPCPGYCSLLKRACGERYGTTFRSDAECATACSALSGSQTNAKYSVTGEDVLTNTYACRVHKLTRIFAATSDSAAGESAVSCDAGVFPADTCSGL